MDTFIIVLVSFVLLGLAADLLRRALLVRRSFCNKHVLVTGGSQGIGKELARQILARGARVTLLARTEAKLAAAAKELSAGLPPGTSSVQYVVASITDMPQLQAAVERAVENFGPVDVLIANAGTATPGLFLEQPMEVYEAAANTNYLGVVRSIKAVLAPMVQQRNGHVVIVASGAAVTSFMGYSSYAPTKWALRGLADTLRNELVGFNIAVQIAYPPDTSTPGFELENSTKPSETAAMIPVDVYSPQRVARSILLGAEAGHYHLPSPDPILNWSVSARAGVTPRWYPFTEFALLPLAGFVESIVCLYFDYWGRRYARRHESESRGVGAVSSAKDK